MKATKKIYLLSSMVSLFLMTGCNGDIEGSREDGTKFNRRGSYNIECIDGVSYYENSKRLAPAFNRDGTIKLCEK